MAKYFDIDTPVRMNGTLTMGGNIIVPSSYGIDATGGGEIKGNVISGTTLIGNGSAITNLSSSAMTDVLKLDGSRSMAGHLTMPSGNQIRFKDTGHYMTYQSVGVDTATLDGIRIAGYSGVELISSTNSTLLAVFRGASSKINSPLTVATSITSTTINATGNLQENGVNLSTKYETKGTLHDDRYYTETEVNTLLNGKANASHTHDYDKYSSWNVQVGAGATEGISSNQTLQFVGGENVSIARNGKEITISSIDTNTWRPITSTASNDGGTSISASWALAHEGKAGVGGHIPTGGSTANFLRGDGTWAVPVNTNNYVTAITGTGNSTLTLSRSGLADLTLNLAHNHNTEYNTKAEITSLLGGKSDVGHTHDFDKYQNWKAQVNGGTAVNIESLGTLNFKSSGTVTLSQSGNAITINGSDTNTWRPIETSPTTSTINSISSSWAKGHSELTGVVGGHIPSGGTTSNFLRGDGVWGTPNDSYLSSVTGGGNGTVTFNRNGMSALTLNLAHNHHTDYNTKTEIANLLAGKSDTSHTHDFDKYQYWRVQVEEDALLNVSSLSTLAFKGSGTVSLGRSGNIITINGADTNTWRPIETSPSTSNTSSISSSWAKGHSESTGVGSHVPTGGTASQYLRGNGTWGTPNDSYLSGVTGSGDGVVTFTRNGMASLTVDLTHNHNDEYNTKAEITTLLGGKANATHTHDYDKYSNWNVQIGTGAVESIGSNNTLQLIAGTNVGITRNGKAITINSDNTWRPIETSPSTSTTNSISSSWAKTHSESVGVSGHIPTGGSTSQYLRGDGVWGTPPNNNNYVSAITSTAGGNGTLTVKQNGLTDLTLNLAHNHDTSYLGIGATATNSTKLENLTASQFLRSDVADSLNADLTLESGKKIIIPASGAKVVLTSSSAITGGTDMVGETDANVRIHSWYGFGVATSNAGGAVSQGNNAFWVDTRSGHSYTFGEFYAQKNKKVYHEGNLTPSTFVVNNTANQIVKTGFTMEGTSYVGASTLAGNLVVRTAGGSSGIQLTGDNTAQLSGVGVYLNSNGTGRFTGQLQVNTLKIDSTAIVQNLNAETVGGTREKDIAKNRTLSDIFGYGVLNGLNLQQQTVPNMTVLVSTGVAFTDSGMRVSITTPTSIALSTSSASYDRIDAIYIQGAVGGNNEGVIGVVAGTPSATPVEPSLPTGAVKLGTVRVLKNIGSILNAHISNVGKNYISIRNDGNGYIWNEKLRTNSITSESTPYLEIEKPIKTNGAISITIPAGQTSATWTHNLGIGTSYAVSFSSNSVEPHVYWTNKTTNAITINLDDTVEVPVIVDVVLTVF